MGGTVPALWERLSWLLVALAVAGLAVHATADTIRRTVPQLAGSTSPGPPPAEPANLPGVEVPVLPSPHIAWEGAPHAPYNSLPPTSGPHLPWAPAPGVYEQPLPDELGVHALEHGHVLVQYSPSLPRSDVDVLERIGHRYPRDVIVAPYPRLASGVALTAWGRIELLPTAEPAPVERFVVALRNRYVHGWTRGTAAG